MLPRMCRLRLLGRDPLGETLKMAKLLRERPEVDICEGNFAALPAPNGDLEGEV